MKSFNLIMVAIITLATIFFIPSISAQTSKSEWVETGIVVEVPYDYPIQQGLTKNNTPKYWLEVDGARIFVSSTNYTKFINKEIRLIIVEWHNTKGQYKYTTRQYKKTRINLTKL